MPVPPDNPNLANELLSAYLDDELSAEERAGVEARLAADPAARETLEGLRSVSAELQRLPDVAPEARLSDEVLRRVRDELSSAGANNADPRLPFGRSPRGWLWAGLAVAASLAMVAFLPDASEQRGRDIAKQDAAASDNMASEEAGGERGAENRAPAEMRAAPALPDELADELADSAPRPDALARRGAAPAAPGASPASPTPLAMRESSPEAEEPPPDAAEFGFAEATIEAPLIVVRVKLNPRAYQQRLVDTVCSNQGIAVEPTTGDPLAESARSRRSLVVSNARSNLQQEIPAAPANSAVAAAAENRRAQVLVVEAPAPQLAAVLNDLRNDVFNCPSIVVTPPVAAQAAAGEGAENADSTAAESVAGEDANAAEPPAQQWLGYNRFTPIVSLPEAKTRPQTTTQWQSRPQAFPGNAYRLQQGELRQLAEESRAGDAATRWSMTRRGVDSRFRQAGAADAKLPAPTDPSGYVQALVIVEPDEAADADVLEAAPATEAAEP